MELNPTPTEKHVIAVDDDYDQVRAICGCGKKLYEGTNRNKKMAACHRHIADIFDPPEAVQVGE